MGRIAYKDYVAEMPDPLTIEEADQIYRQLYAQIDEKDEDLVDFFDTVLRRAKDYAEIRFKWSMMDLSEKTAGDEYRTQKHDAFLNALSMMRTVCEKKGKDASWFDLLGVDIQKTNRKRAGDFACYIMLFRGLNTR